MSAFIWITVFEKTISEGKLCLKIKHPGILNIANFIGYKPDRIAPLALFTEKEPGKWSMIYRLHSKSK